MSQSTVNGAQPVGDRNGNAAAAAAAWERRAVIVTLAGALWLSIAATAVLTLFGVPVPHEVYYLGTAAFGALDALLLPARIIGTRQGDRNGAG